MALKTLSNSGIANGSPILPGQVTQSVNAFTGVEGYAITLSGSFTFAGATTGSGWFQNAVTSSRAESVKVTNNATTNQNFRLLFALDSSLPNPSADGYAQPRFDSGSDGSGIYYNPSINTLYASKISGSNDGSTPDFFGTASYANIANIANTATTVTNFAPSYIGIDSFTYTASTNPYTVAGITPNIVYVSQSTSILGLNFFGNAAIDGQTVTFVTNYRNAGSLTTNNIEISASNVYVYGKGLTNVISFPGNDNLSNLLGGVPSVSKITFQYIATISSFFPNVGWYVVDYIL